MITGRGSLHTWGGKPIRGEKKQKIFVLVVTLSTSRVLTFYSGGMAMHSTAWGGWEGPTSGKAKTEPSGKKYDRELVP